MAVRVVSGCTVFRTACAPPLPRAVLHSRFHLRPSILRGRPNWGPRLGGLYLRRCSFPSLVDSVMEELKLLRSSKRVRASSKVGLLSSDVWILQKGTLLEFCKDSERTLLAVAQKPDGKRNWMVSDQNGITSSIKRQQITYVVPGVENFNNEALADFIQKAQELLDPSLLEYAWMELLEKNRSVTAEELAKIIYGGTEPLECYCAHLLLFKDDIYFSTVKRKGSCSIYEPRSTVQVEEVLHQKRVKKASEKELQEFIELLRSAKAMPHHSKPPRSSWTIDEKIYKRIELLEAYALDVFKSDEQSRTAGLILKAMGLPKMSSVAANLLIDIGYFPVHVNLDLLKYNIRTEYSDEVLMAAENALNCSSDPDEMIRKDFTSLKIYAIDVDEADELDDALSATRLPDGRIKVWIHVADPTCFVQPQSIIDREAMRRGTSIFLPTATFPMFPEKLAMEGMSLQQGRICNAVSVSVVLREDGSIAEYSIDNSLIRPTYMLTYESASELLNLNLEEEADLKILSEAATRRLQWRRQQGAIDTATIEPRIKVINPDDPEPSINLYVENQADPAMRLVLEMMLLCGEVVATFGSHNNIPLPYRGQPQSNISTSAFSHLPEGPVRSAAYVKIMRGAELDFRKPIRHGVLGIPGYVQFTSPIRRYMDLASHYQVKAFLRGESLPFSAGQLEGIASLVNIHTRVAKRLQNSSLRYWLLEFLRRQPKERTFHALVLRFVKDRIAALLLMEVGIEASASVSIGVQIGDEIKVQVHKSHPRDDVLSVKEV
ncbi:hypothetical protein QJS04_geneDACA021603 [Acorus gramineus]|uniref:RNB domain-containing protein n=1 Tax=Acorus gramineus TaxID=55184 RepID=A0AAV9B6T0_ACOGR|nr:hypothetical protein QJS04_geneDACA021603 [Acorus gramineus]